MATAAVESPHDLLAEKTVSVFNLAPTFVSSEKVVLPNAAAKGAEPATNDRFSLNSQSFTHLQLYLLAAMRLPETGANFEQKYPKELFEPYTKKDSPKLYDEMKDVLVGINQHCTSFKKGTMNSMVVLAGTIANFAKDADAGAKKARDALAIICAPGASPSDPKVENAYTSFYAAISSLQTNSKTAKEECQKKVDELGAFKDDVHNDKDKLSDINKRTDKVLPTSSDLNKDLKDKMAAAYKTLNDIVREQNAALEGQRRASSILGYLPLIGHSFVLDGIMAKVENINGVRQATQQFEQIFNSTNAQLRLALQLRSTSEHLKKSIDSVLEAISKAEAALVNMIGAFARLNSDLKDIEGKLESAYGAVGSPMSFRKKAAFEKLEEAGKTWPKVLDLAREFQDKGIAMAKDISTETLDTLPPMLEIIGTNYGGVDNTLYSQVLFNSGEDIMVRSVEPGFPEPWHGTVKSISVLHKYGDSTRIFACREFTGTHYLKPGPISNSQAWGAELNEIKPLSKPAGSKVKILAIVWGPKEVRSQTVYDYVYGCLNSRPVKFDNNNFGGDTWVNNRKSGVVYYNIDGGNTIYQLCGREGAEVEFRA